MTGWVQPQPAAVSFKGSVTLWLGIFICIAHCNGAGGQTNPCLSKTTCQQCIQADYRCAWCSTVLEEPANASSINPRCDYEDNIRNRCDPSDVMAPQGHHEVTRDQPLDVGHQMAPQHIRMSLRPGESQTFQIKYRQAHDYPLDIYFLMDMSYSMRIYKDALSNLAATLVTELQNITTDFRLGFGSFVDKPAMPYTKRPIGDTIPPCEGCAVTYGFKHHMSLSSSDQAEHFKNLVQSTKLSANLDHAEGGFDALMQAVVCKDVVGWRNDSRKIIVFSTDAAFHYAGEGKLAAIVVPNDAHCHMEPEPHTDDWSYTHSLLLDYPSVTEINRVVKQNKVNVLFAIADNPMARRLYTRLSEHVHGSVTGVLTDNGGNIMKLVKAEYNKITSTIALQDTAPPAFVKVTYQSACLGGETSETAVCQGLRVGSEVSWNVTVKLVNCSSDGYPLIPIVIQPRGGNDELYLDLEPLCHCDCQRDHRREVDSARCSRSGTLDCGICVCNEGREGRACECPVSDRPGGHDGDKCIAPNSGSLLCSGRGQCNCGRCECFEREKSNEIVSGQFCECDNYSCDKDDLGRLCGGHGSCVCGQCECRPGWSGAGCNCPSAVDECLSANGKICNGHGTCECGRCKCDQSGEYPHSGEKCEICPTCPSPCHLLKDCVQCRAFGTGDMVVAGGTDNINGTCHHSCLDSEVLLIDEITDEQGYQTCASFRDTSDYCSFTFAYSTVTLKIGRSSIKIQKQKVCPEKVNPYIIVGGIVGAIIFIGILLLLAFKVAVVLYDRQQVKKFREEIKSASWQAAGTPVYRRPASVAFHSAGFRRRREKPQ